MFDNLSFRAMESSINALWMKQNAIVHNLANVETPGYKAKSVSFKNVLADAKKDGAKGASRYDFKAVVTTDLYTEARPDGNNVDVDKENIELMDAYYQSLALYQKISGQISDLRYVIGQSFK